MEIKLGNILIKELSKKDIGSYVELKKDLGVKEEDIIDILDNDFDTYLHLIVFNKINIGDMVYRFEGKKAYIDLGIYDLKYLNKGIESKVLTSLLFYLFNMYKVEKVITTSKNIKLYEDAGFTNSDFGYCLESKRYHELYRCDK